jgi:hypothetical protein
VILKHAERIQILKKTSSEYENFADLLGKVVQVPHSEIKAKLDSEKRAKKRKVKRASSSRVKGAKPTSD